MSDDKTVKKGNVRKDKPDEAENHDASKEPTFHVEEVPKSEDFGFDVEKMMGPGFSKEFQRLQEMIAKMLQNGMSGDDAAFKAEPFVCGFNVRMSPDGKVRLDRFGNTDPTPKVEHIAPKEVTEETTSAQRSPLTDLIDDETTISLTVEIPGVEKKDIDLNVEEKMLTIHVDSETRKYFKEIPLQCAVDINSAIATYKNGVLDITLTKEKRRKSGKKISID